VSRPVARRRYIGRGRKGTVRALGQHNQALGADTMHELVAGHITITPADDMAAFCEFRRSLPEPEEQT